MMFLSLKLQRLFLVLIGKRRFGVLSTQLLTLLMMVCFSKTASSQNEQQKTDSVPAYISNHLSLAVATGISYDSTFVKGKLKKRGQKVTFFGYYRLFLYGRNMHDYYPGLPPYTRTFSVGDGYREPMLSLTAVARPNGKSSFGTELFFYTPYDGTISNNVFSTNLGISLYGNFRTDHGTFGIRAGGINWYTLSPFTIGVYQVLDRFSIFDRTPWEGVNNTDKYNSYWSTGTTSPGDLRWNNQAFQGLIINGAKLPGKLGFDLFWGKTQPNGGLINAGSNPLSTIQHPLDAGSMPTYIGFAGQKRVMPDFLTGGRLVRSFGQKHQTFAYNFLLSRTALDSIVSDSIRSYQVQTVSLDMKLGDVAVTGELGGGRYQSPTYDPKWGEALMLRFKIPKNYTFLPFDIQVYQISNNFYNENGEISTNTNERILQSAGLPAGATGTGGLLPQSYQLVSNRRGVTVGTEYDLGPLKLSATWAISHELVPSAATLSFVHRINGLALSRIYNPFPANATGPIIFGPYNRKLSFFRGVSEIVQTTDLDPATGLARNRKYFNTLDLQAKLNTNLFSKSLYFFYLGYFGGVTQQAKAIPTYDKDAYLSVQYHEFDMYYQLLPKFILAGYFGYERAKGGQYTRWNEQTNLPMDQIGTSIGTGFDWTLSKNSGLYIRHRWMYFKDRSFPLDHYRGQEITVELKTFF